MATKNHIKELTGNLKPFGEYVATNYFSSPSGLDAEKFGMECLSSLADFYEEVLKNTNYRGIPFPVEQVLSERARLAASGRADIAETLKILTGYVLQKYGEEVLPKNLN